jgi:hypothetical protein
LYTPDQSAGNIILNFCRARLVFGDDVRFVASASANPRFLTTA